MELAAILAPLVSAVWVGLLGKQMGDKASNFVACALMAVAAVCSVLVFRDVTIGGNVQTLELFRWISSGDLQVSWALYLDTLSAVMLMVVNIVSLAVHVYSVGYMSHDAGRIRFMAYLGLFTFAMLMLVTASNFVQLFFGWEGVGLASYLLIGFWNTKDSANKAAVKAFVVNRVGDFALCLGVLAVFFLFGTLNFAEVFDHVVARQDFAVLFLGQEIHGITLICTLLFIGAMGKSAQLGLHVWLPDAMEGPTPVSALIHAATMVTAGVFLLARMSPLFEYAHGVRECVTVVGALTAVVAATIALTQHDIKKVIAYSTMSQLGYMFFALGVSAYGAAIFHLFTHAFFKALLFLGAGSVIHAMGGEQDMRKMGGLYRLLPTTYMFMWAGSLALAGIPFFAGYFSKDIILEASFAAHSPVGLFAYWSGIAAALMTAFYSWRLIFLTFHGKTRASKTVLSHVHEAPASMSLPMHALMVGAVFSGWWMYSLFVGEGRGQFWQESLLVLKGNDPLDAVHHMAAWVKYLPTAAALSGIALAYYLYLRNSKLPERIAGMCGAVYRLLLNKWYFDEIYDRCIVRPVFYLGEKLSREVDEKLIDRLGPNGAAWVVQQMAQKVSRLQSGYIYHYAFAMIAGMVLLLTAYIALEAR